MKDKACAYCGKEFLPLRPMQSVCSPTCASKKVRADKAVQRKEQQAKAKVERARDKQRRRELETIPELIRKAQHEFNGFVRARDSEKPCICCGQPLGEGDVGGAFDCGHYRSTGSASHLRFDERNAHGQRKHCNRWGAGRAVDYRVGLIGRIGLHLVEALEADNRVHKWERDELRDLVSLYRRKRKELEKTNDGN